MVDETFFLFSPVDKKILNMNNMGQVIFLKTFIPKRDFKETFEIGNMMVRHLGAVFDEEIGVYSCYECSVPINLFDENEVQKAFEEFQSKLKASELATAKAQKITGIDNYDTSSSVNGFELNGKKVWLDKTTRVGLMNSTTIAKAMGETETTLWLGDVKLVVACDKAIKLLSALEMYALECFNVTAAHKAAVEKLQTVEEVEAYDYTQGYPEQLKMEV